MPSLMAGYSRIFTDEKSTPIAFNKRTVCKLNPH